MSLRYFRYSFDEALTSQEASRRASAAGGVIVRVDSREGSTRITLATSQEPAKVEGLSGEPVEVSEKDLLDTRDDG
jgi:hypothetical protein